MFSSWFSIFDLAIVFLFAIQKGIIIIARINFGQSIYIYPLIFLYILYILFYLFVYFFTRHSLRFLRTILSRNSCMTLDRSAFDKKKKKDSVYIHLHCTTDKHSYKHRNTQNTQDTQEEIRLSMKKKENKRKKEIIREESVCFEFDRESKTE